MKNSKLKQLFAAARRETAPVPPENFAADVLRVIHREAPPVAPEVISVLDQLNSWFPRLTLAASAFIVLCVALDYGLTAAGMPSLSDGAAQLSAQWLLTPTGL